jgi:stage II sporulation protein D
LFVLVLAALLAAFPAAVVFASPAAANAGAGLYITGAGYGHGVGMSQYGAAGYAQHGYSYRQILQRYYAQTTLGSVDPDQTFTVLMKASGAAAFSGAVKVQGSKVKLNPSTTYSVATGGGKLRLKAPGKNLGPFKPPLQVTGTGPLTLVGMGTYRGSFVFRPSTAGGVMTVNSLGLDEYVQGVVTAEMPSSWPQQALDTQAVAARTYAITTSAVGRGYDIVDNSDSQAYGGVKAETPTGIEAVAATRGQVVEYGGKPVATYFFSSSGGETESVQNVFAGGAPEPWLVGQPDPYDDSYGNPHYRWKINLSLGAAEAKLGKLVKGQLKAIKILKHGVSPRVVLAQIIGTKGTTTTTGVQLRTDFDAPSAWMSFTTISAQGVKTTSVVSATTTTATSAQTTTPGGTGANGGAGVGSSG